MPHPSPTIALLTTLLLALALAPLVGADQSFSAHALRGVTRVAVTVEGVPADAGRYGLTALGVEQQIAARLTAAGLEVLPARQAASDRTAGLLQVKLTANLNFYSYYHYALSFRLQRKVPLDAEGASFIGETVWSRGQSGVLNPSDLARLYEVAGVLTEAFIAAQDADNG